MESKFDGKYYRYLAERRDKSGIAVAPSLLEACDAVRAELGADSRNDFVELALRFLLYSCTHNLPVLNDYLRCGHMGEDANGKYQKNGGA